MFAAAIKGPSDAPSCAAYSRRRHGLVGCVHGRTAFRALGHGATRPGKELRAFQQDDFACRQYAWQQTGGASPGAAASQSAVGSAVVGTALGAAAGAAIGSVSGAAGAGAAIGGATGLLAAAQSAPTTPPRLTAASSSYTTSATPSACTRHGDTVQAPPVGYASYPYPYPIRPTVCLPWLLRPGVLCSVGRVGVG